MKSYKMKSYLLKKQTGGRLCCYYELKDQGKEKRFCLNNEFNKSRKINILKVQIQIRSRVKLYDHDLLKIILYTNRKSLYIFNRVEGVGSIIRRS